MSEEEKPPPPSPLASPLATGKPRTAPPLTKLNRPKHPPAPMEGEDGGPAGPEPTRYNDWERKGRVSDF